MRTVITALLCLLCFVSTMGTTAAQGLTCDSFKDQQGAQNVLNASNADVLDPDGDGVACEELPEDVAPSGGEDRGDDGGTDAGTRGDELTSQERTYLSDLSDGLTTLGEASTEIGELFTDASEDPSLLVDQEWIHSIAGEFVTIQRVDTEAQTLNPSQRQDQLQELWLGITGLTSQATLDFTDGIDNLDPDAIALGSERYTYASLLVNDLSEALDAFGRNPGRSIEPDHVIGPVDDCEAFDSYADAQDYYRAHPEDGPTIDPNGDNRACEVFFNE